MCNGSFEVLDCETFEARLGFGGICKFSLVDFDSNMHCAGNSVYVSIVRYVFLFRLSTVFAAYDFPIMGVLDSTIFVASAYEKFCLVRTV